MLVAPMGITEVLMEITEDTIATVEVVVVEEGFITEEEEVEDGMSIKFEMHRESPAIDVTKWVIMLLTVLITYSSFKKLKRQKKKKHMWQTS